jgi:hypothetical protein
VNFWQKYLLLFFGQNLWIYPKIVFCIIVRLINGYNSLDDIASYFLNLPLQKHILLFFGQNLTFKIEVNIKDLKRNKTKKKITPPLYFLKNVLLIVSLSFLHLPIQKLEKQLG